MGIRNYAELSPYDFENLVRDLFQAHWNVRLEMFPPGKDGGVDVRLFRDGARRDVIQCKHAPGKTWSGLRQQTEREADANADRDLRRYHFVTSARLTEEAKKKISKLFSAQGLEESEVFGREDLDNLLNLHPEVELANYKLYLSSVAALQRILKNKAFTRREGLLERLLERNKLFVQSGAFGEASDVLDRQRVVIVSGEPGVGKTTLAEMLTLSLIEKGYEPFVVGEDISEVDDLWRKEGKQVFLYDDFLGQTSLAQKLAPGEDRRLADTVERLQKSQSHLLIMTTREYILRSAQQTYARLSEQRLDLSKVIIDLATYTRFQRGHILYNHVYFSLLPREARESLVQDSAYKSIIDHRNFNPRLVEMIIQSALLAPARSNKEGFAKFAVAGLDDPSQLWSHILEYQLSVTARDVVYVLASMPHEVSYGDLQEALIAYRTSHTAPKEFKDAIRILESVFIDVEADVEERTVSFRNPGVRDFVVGHLLENDGTIGQLVERARFNAQIDVMYNWTNSSKYRAARAWSSIPTMQQTRVTDTLRAKVEACVGTVCRSIGLEGSTGSHDAVLPERISLALLGFLEPGSSRHVRLSRQLFEELVGRWESGRALKGETIKLLEVIWPALEEEQRLRCKRAVARWTESQGDPEESISRVKLLDVISDDESQILEAIDDLVEEVRSRLEEITQDFDSSGLEDEISSLEDFLLSIDRADELESEFSEARQHAENRPSQEPELAYDPIDRFTRDTDRGDLDELFGSLSPR